MANISGIRAIYFSLPIFGGGLLNYCVVAQFQIFATDQLQISAAVVGVLFLVMRFWDALSDPLIGVMSDRSQSKLGRRKFFIIVSALPVAIFFFGLWLKVPFFSGLISQEVYTAICLFGFFTALTALYVPHYSLTAEIEQDRYFRNRLFGSRAVLEMMGTVGGVVAIALLDKREPFDSAARIMLVLALGYLAFVVIFAKAIPEKTDIHLEQVKFSFHFIKNKFFMRVLLLGFISQSVATIILTGIPYYARYIMETPDFEAGFQVAFIFPAILAIPAWVFFSRKKTKHSLWATANAGMAIAMLAMFFLPLSSLSLPQNAYVVMFFCAVCGICAGCVLFINPAFMADAIDVEEKKTGVRTEGLFFAIYTFINKCAMGLAVFGFSLTLELSHYVPLRQQAAETQLAIKIVYILAPVALLLLAVILLKTFRWQEYQINS